MASANTLVAFFGATGGCCAAALTRSLNDGFSCTARMVIPFLDESFLAIYT